MFFYVFSCHIIKFNHFLYCFIILRHLISSFLHSRSLLIPYISTDPIDYNFVSNFFIFRIMSMIVLFACISIEPVDSIILLSLAVNAVLLTSLVNTLCFSLLNVSCDFIINPLAFYEFFMFFF